MDKAAKPTALFFGFLAASMTYVSAQAADPAAIAAAASRTVAAIQRDAGVDMRQPANGLEISATRRAPKSDQS